MPAHLLKMGDGVQMYMSLHMRVHAPVYGLAWPGLVLGGLVVANHNVEP